MLNRRPRLRGVTSGVQLAAREMRKQPTPAEAALWDELRRKGCAGARFRRQHPVDRFVLDFYCPALLLAVEVDGAGHLAAEQHEYDVERSQILAARGIAVHRVPNEAVLMNLDRVLEGLGVVIEARRRQLEQS